MKVIGGLVLSATIVGGATGLLLFNGIGIFVTLPLALLVAVLFGTPAYFVLKYLGWLSWWQLALAGTVLVSPLAIGFSYNPYFASVTLVSGAAAGLVFWWASIEPNKAFKPTAGKKPPAAA